MVMKESDQPDPYHVTQYVFILLQVTIHTAPFLASEDEDLPGTVSKWVYPTHFS